MGRIAITTETIRNIKELMIISKIDDNVEKLKDDSSNRYFYRISKIIASGNEFELKVFLPSSQQTLNNTTTKSAKEITNGKWYIE